MECIALPTVTLPRAAYAAGFSVRALRTIMAPPRPFVLLGQPDRAPNAWTRFAPVDVVRLAIVRRLLDYGLCVADAQSALDRSVDRYVFGLATCGIELPVSFLINQLAGLRLHVAAATESGLTVSCGALARTHDTTLILDVDAIARAALHRLAQGTAT